jgi:hypothetical protein
MTYSQQHLREATPRQLALLKNLAMERGQSFAYPPNMTFAQADVQIKQLKRTKPTRRSDRRRDDRQVRQDLAERSGGSISVRRDELAGYGSHAAWR